MLDSVAVHLVHFVLTQPENEAEPWVQYLILGVIGCLILWVLAKAFSNQGHLEKKAPTADSETDEAAARSKTELEAEARRRFEIPEVMMGEAPSAAGFPQVRIKRTEVDSTPTTRDAAITDSSAADSQTTASAEEARPATEPAADPSAERAGKTLKEGLAKTNAGFIGKLGQLFGKARALDDDLLAELEEALFTADIGVRTSQRLVRVPIQ